MEEEEEGNKEIDWILDNIVGGSGKWQWFVIALSWPVTICGAFPAFVYLFASFEPRHRCFIPGCDDLDGQYDDPAIMGLDFLDFALPKEHSESKMLQATEAFDPCRMFANVTNQMSCSADNFDSSNSVPCQSWIYERNEFQETITTQFDLVCDNDHKRRLLGTIMMLGFMLGSLIGGITNDKFGRKKTMLFSCIVTVATTIGGGYSPNYLTYAVLRLICCTSLPPSWVATHNLALEIFNKENRRLVVIVKEFAWPFTSLVLVLLAYYSNHWTYLHLFTGLFSAIGIVTAFFMPESIRWLASNNRKEEAVNVLLTAAKWNRKQEITEDQKTQIRVILDQMEAGSKEKNETTLNPLTMFKTAASIKKTLILLFTWSTVNLGNWTLTLNSTRLSGNVFTNYSLTTIVGDIPGTIAMMVTMKYFSRRFNLLYTQLILGLSCVTLAFIPKTETNWVLVFYLAGKCFASSAFVLVWMVTAELFPTNLRSQAIGICSTVARIVGLVAPFVASLGKIWQPLPMLVLGIPSFFSGLLVYYCIPETANTELPQTTTDASNMDKKTSK